MIQPRCAVYARYSSEQQREQSIADQLRVCYRRAESEGWQVVEVLSDAAISGATTERPGYQALLCALRAGAIDVVLTESLDRLSRDQEYIASFYKQAVFARVRVITLAEGEISELHIGLKGTMGALYLKDLADKTRRGLEGRARAGRGTGRAPYGYRFIRGKLAENGELERGLREIDPAKATVVQKIFRDYAAGVSPKAIARSLNADGIAGPAGGPWLEGTIRGRAGRGSGILRNPLYAGRGVWNRQQTLKDPTTGKCVNRPNPRQALVTTDLPELRLIDEPTWAAVQDRLARDATARIEADGPHFWERRRPHSVVSGKVFCGECGRTFKAVGSDYLACTAAREGICTNRAFVRRGRLEHRVCDALAKQLMDPGLADEFSVAFEQEWKRLAAEQRAGMAGHEEELRDVERRITHLVDALAEGVAAYSVKQRLVALEARRSKLEASLKACPPPAPQSVPNLGIVYRERVAALNTALGGAEATEAREAARALIDRIVIGQPDDDGGPPRIELFGDLAAMLGIAGVTPFAGPAARDQTSLAAAALRSAKKDKGRQSLPHQSRRHPFGSAGHTNHAPLA
ncbi:recombinase family protein [Falsiroseomonas ponticola]|uniref:recombinase family protein n=1 Tax=Falsiroseomonas ponticola TaxID=2786951 RepID=UPI0019339600|nr:recombinase family protein [Roseomonas ponticola]